MAVATQLLAFRLRQVIDVPPDLVENVIGAAVDVAATAGTAGRVFALVRQRLTDHANTLPRALTAANDRAWQAVAVALAGRGFFTSVKEFFTGRTPKALHEQVEAFLSQNADGFPGTSHEFRKTCLRELHQAQKAGLLAAGPADPDGWARKAAAYRGLADPHGRIGEAHQAAAAVADALPRDYPNLARLLREAAPAGQAPLLVVAFSFFFRRQVETSEELHRGLTFAGLKQLSERQEAGFEALGQGLVELHAQLTAQGRKFGDVLDHLARIEEVVVGIDAKVDAIDANLTGLRAELRELAARNHVHDGPPRPQFVITINNEREQNLARRLLAEVRKLPPERQGADDLSLLGDVLRAAGLYPEATDTYAQAAAQAEDRAARAANNYKRYLTALEQRRWDEGLAALTAAADLDAPSYAPFPLRQYEPRRILGAGGFGTAFLCRHRYLNREVVIKSLFHADLEQGVNKVFAEAQTLLLLSRKHPSIIGVQDCAFADEAQQRPYIVMDYFPGVSLQAHLEQLGPETGLPLEDFLPIARQIVEAMQAAHGRGILHRDLKPDNVLVRKKDGRWLVKVIDFGLAVRLRTVKVSTSRPVSERTMYGNAVAGTVKYASPEQMGEMPGVEPDTYSDVYTFGKLCCYTLFRDTEPQSQDWKQIPPALHEMLEGCIAKKLSRRRKTFQPVLDVLKALDRGEAERRRRAEEKARRDAERRRQEEERRQTEERQAREREETERQREEQELVRLRQEGEAKLRQLVREAYERGRGKPSEDDNRAAAKLCRRHQLSPERAKAIAREVREQWQKAQPRDLKPGQVLSLHVSVPDPQRRPGEVLTLRIPAPRL